jgi:hypothetical protein
MLLRVVIDGVDLSVRRDEGLGHGLEVFVTDTGLVVGRSGPGAGLNTRYPEWRETMTKLRGYLRSVGLS